MSQSRILKITLAALSLSVASVTLFGCDTGERPSQMVKLRGQMMDQRKAMGGRQGGSAPTAPPTPPAGN